MGEILLINPLTGSLNPKLPSKGQGSLIRKRPAFAVSSLLETENSILKEQKTCKEEPNEQPTSKKQKKQLLEGYQIVLDLPLSMNMKEKQLLRKKILDNGGTVSYVVTRKSNVVVSGGEEVNPSKHKMAKKYGVPVVMQSYIEKCVMKQQLLDVKDFLLSSELKSSGFSKGKIIADSATDTSLLIKPKTVSLTSLKPQPYEDLHGYTFVKAVLLQSRKFHKARTNKFHFYVLELHAASGEKDCDITKQFCVYTDEGYLDAELNGNILSSKKLCYYLETADEALSAYSQLYFAKSGQPHCMIQAKEILHPSLGTPEFQKLQLEWSATLTPVDKSVLNLVDVIWMEAIGHLDKFLTVHPATIPLWKVDEAEGILLQISSILTRDNWEELAERLSEEFYSILPHNEKYKQPIITKKILSQKQDLCQVLRDMVSISEASGWSQDGSFHAKYGALHCYIEKLISDTEKYEKIEQFLIESQLHATGIEIQEIYHIHRYLEAAEFSQNLPNKQLLFHATSPSNLVGILSQGLNLPKMVVQERGVERFDVGMLGGGIYFTNSLSTCIKYSRTSKERGTRFLLVCEVALGKIYETKKFDTSLTAPPDGFDSVHGVKGTESAPSDFMDDEFVIYTPCQQCMLYLVEFTLPEDQIKPYRTIDELSEFCNTDSNIYSLDLKDAEEKPKGKPKSGLQVRNESETADLPLKEVHIRAQLLDLVAQVVVFQAYKNVKESPLECKYVFPLERGAAVCGFEAFIDKKHVVGKIKRKEIAHKEYKEAISKGYGAYLMDEENPDVFTVSVGNIPPLASVIIKITYILELPVNDEIISFNIPASVAPWIEHQAVHQVTQDVTDSVTAGGICQFSIQISVEMPFPIDTITSPTHDVCIKRTETRAVIRTNPGMNLSDGFTLLVGLKEIHVPRMWTQIDDDDDQQASMLVFYPEFDVKQSQHSEIIIVLDASNSMQGEAFQSALQTVLHILMALPQHCYFNIVAFGTVFQELFPSSHQCSANNIKKAKAFLKNIMPSLGNTELFHLLRYYQLTAGNIMKNVIIISDGHINNEGTVLRNAKLHCSKVRVFTCGVSMTANKHMLCQLACWGSGAFEYMNPAEKSKWKSQVKAQLDRAMQAALANVRIEWQNFNDFHPKILQAPQQIMSIFNGCRQVVYGFVPECSMAKLVAVIDGKEYETVVSNSNIDLPFHTMLHKLAARAVIRDWEDGLLAVERAKHLAERKQKEEEIVEFSKKYNLVTSITSFIAVEERDKDEVISDNALLLTELLGEEDLDTLHYMEFEKLEKNETRQYVKQKKRPVPYSLLHESFGLTSGPHLMPKSSTELSEDEDVSSEDLYENEYRDVMYAPSSEDLYENECIRHDLKSKWRKLSLSSDSADGMKQQITSHPTQFIHYNISPRADLRPLCRTLSDISLEDIEPLMSTSSLDKDLDPKLNEIVEQSYPLSSCMSESRSEQKTSAKPYTAAPFVDIDEPPLIEPAEKGEKKKKYSPVLLTSKRKKKKASREQDELRTAEQLAQAQTLDNVMQMMESSVQACSAPPSSQKHTCSPFLPPETQGLEISPAVPKVPQSSFSSNNIGHVFGGMATVEQKSNPSFLKDPSGSTFGVCFSGSAETTSIRSSEPRVQFLSKTVPAQFVPFEQTGFIPPVTASSNITGTVTPMLAQSTKSQHPNFGFGSSAPSLLTFSSRGFFGASSKIPQSQPLSFNAARSMVSSSLLDTTNEQQPTSFGETELTSLDSVPSRIRTVRAELSLNRSSSKGVQKKSKMSQDELDTSSVNSPAAIPQFLCSSRLLKSDLADRRSPESYKIGDKISASSRSTIAREPSFSPTSSHLFMQQSRSHFASQDEPLSLVTPKSQLSSTISCSGDTNTDFSSPIPINSRHVAAIYDTYQSLDIDGIMQDTAHTSTYLKDLVKCKGGLPLCNSVDRHLRIFARKAYEDDVIKLIDGTMQCYSSCLEIFNDYQLWSTLPLDQEKLMSLKTLMENIAIDGYCKEEDCLKLDIITEQFSTKLDDAGLMSLGTKTAIDIKRMLATLAVLLYFTQALLESTQEKISGQQDFQKLENLSQLLAFSLVKYFPATTSLLLALKFVRSVEHNHSLVYKSLDCGTNWEEFIIDYVNKPHSITMDMFWADIADSPDVSMCYGRKV